MSPCENGPLKKIHFVANYKRAIPSEKKLNTLGYNYSLAYRSNSSTPAVCLFSDPLA